VHVVVVGSGRVGAGLARAMEEQGHSVAIIDKQARSFRRLPEDFGGRKVVGIGFDRDRLREAGVEEADALAAVTNGDNSNILVARVARETFQVERVVARIYDPRRAKIYERLGIPTIATVEWATERVLHRLLPDVATVEWIDPSAKVALVERSVPSAWSGHKVAELDREGASRVVAIARLGVASLPASDLRLQDGDVAHVAVTGDDVDSFDRLLAAGPSAAGH
jgi:trk system potassium uptake protein TrkA